MARTDFRAAAARRLSEDTELSPAIVSLLSPDSPTRSVGVRIVPVDHIRAEPRAAAAGLRAGGARRARRVDPRARRPPADPRPAARPEHLPDRRRRAPLARLAAGRASRRSRRSIEDIDDDTALEIAIIENLQREDLTPLDEAAMYDRMVHEHGYSIRKLADKLGKDKGYLENRLRLADAPPEIRELVSLRKDSLSHAYELMKVEDPKKRRRLAEQVAPRRADAHQAARQDRGAPGRQPGRSTSSRAPANDPRPTATVRRRPIEDEATKPGRRPRPRRPSADPTTRWSTRSRASPTRSDELVGVLADPEVRGSIGATDRANLAEVPDDRRSSAWRTRSRWSAATTAADLADRRATCARQRRPDRGRCSSPSSAARHAGQPGGGQQPDPDRLEPQRALASRRSPRPADDPSRRAHDASRPAARRRRSDRARRRTPACAIATTDDDRAGRRRPDPRPFATEAVATESTPAAASRSRSARALAMASAASRPRRRPGSRTAKDGRQAAGRAEPAEDGQERDPDRERDPRTRPSP